MKLDTRKIVKKRAVCREAGLNHFEVLRTAQLTVDYMSVDL